jgi:hypothetical protein
MIFPAVQKLSKYLPMKISYWPMYRFSPITLRIKKGEISGIKKDIFTPRTVPCGRPNVIPEEENRTICPAIPDSMGKGIWRIPGNLCSNRM